MLFHFPKDGGVFAPMPATSRMTAWISYSAKVHPAQVGNCPARPSFTGSVTDTRACICQALVFSPVLCLWLLTMAAFHAASDINHQRHKPLLAFWKLTLQMRPDCLFLGFNACCSRSLCEVGLYRCERLQDHLFDLRHCLFLQLMIMLIQAYRGRKCFVAHLMARFFWTTFIYKH